jgi:hypothetical protein
MSLNASERAALDSLPLPANDGVPAEWGAGIRPDGRWGVYTLNGITREWSGLTAAGSREAVAMSRHLNLRGAWRP